MSFPSNNHEKVLVVGLGNPGPKYEDTRHNAGFLFIDELLENLINQFGDDSYSFNNRERKLEAHVISIDRFLIAKPVTYMNNSGSAVQKLAKFYKISPGNIALAYDDLDIKLGNYKISADKSPKAHNGVDSVKRHIGEYGVNIRLGVDSRQSESRIPGIEYVLQKFSSEERHEFEAANSQACKEFLKY